MNLIPDKEVTVADRRDSVYIRPRTIENMFSAMRWSKADGEKQENQHRRHSSLRGSNKFCKTQNIDEYIDMLDKGWETGVKDMQELAGITSDSAEQLVFTRAPGGAFPVVPAHLANDPNSMMRPTLDVSENKRGLTLVIDSCFSGGVSARTILDYAQDIMRLVAWLQAERIECSVYSIIPIELDDKRVVYTVPIREAGQVFQPERIAAVLHPSWLRRAWFAMLEYEYYETDGAYPEARACQYGYGSVTHANADEMRQALPEAYSVIMLPKPGQGDPTKAVEEVTNLKIRVQS